MSNYWPVTEAIALSAPTAGRMSGAARRRALARLHAELFPQAEAEIFSADTPQPCRSAILRERSKELRELAARGMSPRKFEREAQRLDAEAAKLENANPQEETRQ